MAKNNPSMLDVQNNPFIPSAESQKKRILDALGLSAFDELISDVPQQIQTHEIPLESGISEMEILQQVDEIGDKNQLLISFAGGGIYDHFIPKTVNSLITRSEFITAYTPYQAEVSQGTLQAMFEFQSLICELTGMDITNASMYDGATATAEAVLMASNATSRNEILMLDSVNPEYRKVVKTYCKHLPISIKIIRAEQIAESLDENTAAVVVQSPNYFGFFENFESQITEIHENKSLVIQIYDPISLALFKTPGEMDVDIAIAEGQSLGNAMNFGGPLLGLFSCKKKLVRKMPGRLVGETVDTDGKRGFVLTLQTREQHIRRERATSNICTNQGLCALAATIHLALAGKSGMRQIAELCYNNAHQLAEKLTQFTGVSLISEQPFFKEFTISLPCDAEKIVEKMAKQGFLAGIANGKNLTIAVTEKRTEKEMTEFVGYFEKLLV